MKAPRRDDAFFGSERVRRRLATPRVSDESLFSWLLEMEDQLRSGTSTTPSQELGRRKASPTQEPKRLTRRTLSRYIE
jgi:hypothetical protein